MKDATPSDIAINNVIGEIQGLILYSRDLISKNKVTGNDIVMGRDSLHRKLNSIIAKIEQLNTFGYLSDKIYKKIKPLFLISDDVVFEIALDVFGLSAKNRGHIEDIVTDLYPTSQENYFIVRMNTLLSELKKCLSKKEKAKTLILGLKDKLVWEQITIILKGDSIEIKQNDKSLGEYLLDELAFPKPKSKRTVRGLFFTLFSDEANRNRETLSSKDNKNQKLKGTLSEVLCNIFNTNIDPIEINALGLYKAKFRTTYGGELRINDHRSGAEYIDNLDYGEQ